MGSLKALHPHEEFSAALSFLYCFGLPSETTPFVERDIEKAILFAREGAFQAACGRCFTLLGFLLSISFPPLLGASHLTLQNLMILEPIVLPTRRLPRDVGRWDAAAAAYQAAEELRDVFGVLASNYLRASKQIQRDLQAPRAFSVLSRVPYDIKENERCGVNALGQVAAEIVEDLGNRSWGHLPSPLSEQTDTLSKQLSFLEYVLADPNGAEKEDLKAAASLLESHGDIVLSKTARRHSAAELFRLAAERGDAEAALRQAVEATFRAHLSVWIQVYTSTSTYTYNIYIYIVKLN